MMFKFYSFLVLILLCVFVFSCDDKSPDVIPSSKKKKETIFINNTEDKITIENGVKTIYFGNSDKKKIEGPINLEGRWEGKVVAYFKNGIVKTNSEFSNGKKNGLHEVFYSTGQLFYSGEYFNDKEIGKWFFYDSNGVFAAEKDYNLES